DPKTLGHRLYQPGRDGAKIGLIHVHFFGGRSGSFRGGILDCFVARAPRNDGAEAVARNCHPL
ncbi:hypothetical protein ABIB85_005242, partial [Bradyrhizobium sp. JR1.5]|uniref:hypothetical protein n=1 Tax=unclassified Bradyrhizobium TaxID=2631580 RepID=UPI003395F5E9